MAKIRREEVIVAALDLLNDVGLDALSTRGLAQRLGVESPTLYWHFRDKATLLKEMAAYVETRLHNTQIPQTTGEWPRWFSDNARNFRDSLLAFRDGARLHAGSKPDDRALEQLEPKLQYLVRAGIQRHEALMALLAAGQFTIGCVLEEQARQYAKPSDANDPLMVTPSTNQLASVVNEVLADGLVAYEFGLKLIVDGLERRISQKPKNSDRMANHTR